MTETLLKTKLILPVLRSQLVQRTRLNVMLKQSLAVPLTLISAPPGFGKTTAVRAALLTFEAQADVALAWLSLDEADSEPARFWRYVVAALQQAVPEAPHLADLAMMQPFPLAELLNEIVAVPQHVLLVLDDYHLISQHDLHEGLAFLLDHAPPNFHLMLVTRADPPLPLHRLRVRGELVEIRAADLRFEHEEATGYLNGMMALNLTDNEIARLTEQTEGWAAGLQLAALALQGTANAPAGGSGLIERLSASKRYIVEYLAEEVLARQPQQIQAFLLHTATLNQLCGPLCDAVTQGHGSQTLLETLERRNLFVVPLGTAGELVWFRYHRLFADLLQGQLRQQQPGLIPLLHQRAAVWYEAHGDAESAIEHALDGEDYERAVRLLDLHAGAMTMDGRLLTIERWLHRLPESWQHRLPRVNFAFAWALLMRGRYGTVEPHLQSAEASMGPDDAALRGELYALRAALADAQGQAQTALDFGREALLYVSPDNLFLQGAVHMALAGALRITGDLDAAIAAYETAIPLCEAAGMLFPALVSRAQLGYLLTIQGRLRQAEAVTRPVLAQRVQHPAASAVAGCLADLLIEWNQLDQAEEYIHVALSLAQRSGHNAALARCQIILARLRRTQGDGNTAQAALDSAAAQVAQGVPGWVEIALTAERVMLWLDQNRVGAAENLLNQQRIGVDDVMGHMREVLPLVWARVRYAQQRYAEGRTMLDEVLQAAQGRQGRVIEALLLRALVSAAEGDSSAAHHDLKRALALAEPEGYLRLFLDLGLPLAALLTQMTSPYAQHILQAFPSHIRDAIHIESGLPEALTEREIEVLRLMARGLTYQQIADDLVVSINTVRHHVKGIYSKLDAETRTLALEKARVLNLL